MTSMFKLVTNVFRTTAISVLSCISEAMRLIGPGLLVNPEHKEKLCKILMQILRHEHLSQEDMDDHDEDGEGSDEDSGAYDVDADQSEQDGLLITAAADVVACLAITLGPEFANDYRHFHPFIMKHVKPNRSAAEKSMAVGTMAEVALGLKHGVIPFVPEFLTALSAGLTDEAPEVRSNSAYGIGSMISFCLII
jgi:hypothetical protein